MWTITVGGKTISEADPVGAGAWAALFTACNAAGVSHHESELHPLHCPICRNVFVAYAIAVVDDTSLVDGLNRVGEWSRDQVLDAVGAAPDVKLAETG